MPSPSPPRMPAPAPALPPTVAATFIATHTALDYTVPLLEECPICLDNYATESCLRIIGIAGCTHRVGHTCLEEMLRNHPSEEKKCPLCRSVWIAAPPTARRARLRREPGVIPVRIVTDNGENVALPNARPLAATANPFPTSIRQAQPNLINLDSYSEGENYNTQLENFNNMTRDIENVRARARNTLVPRGQRRREMRDATARSRASTRPGSANASSFVENARPSGIIGGSPVGNRGRGRGRGPGAATSLNRFQDRILNPFVNPFRPGNNAPNPARSEAAQVTVPLQQMGRELESTERLKHQYLDALRDRAQNESQPPRLNFETSAAAATFRGQEIIEAPPIQVQDVRDTVRARQLDQRHLQLVQRDSELSAREARLDLREAALDARERQIVATSAE